MKFREKCEIVERKNFTHYLYLKMKTDRIAGEVSPGQFINIRVNESFDPFLRRPMSVCDRDGDFISVLVQIKGRATKILSEKREGDFLNIIGPLGNTFPLTSRKAIFVAGGIGVAPLLFLSRILKPEFMLLGVKTSEFLPDLEAFPDNMEIMISSDDGSTGTEGSVLELLKGINLEGKTLYACGPNSMLRELSEEIKKFRDIDAFYSIETIMGCGFGVCKGCSVETVEGNYRLACIDGPVFRWDGVKL